MKITIRVRALAAALALAAFFIAAPPAAAQNFPSRPITFIYPYAAGSNADTSWRIINQEVGRRTGQSVVQDNRPGAGGRTGLDAVLRSPADGYTLGMFNNAIGVWAPLIDPRLTIEPVKDYTAITIAIETPLVLMARAGLPFKDIRGLIAYAKANPGKLNASSPGPGTGGHLGIAMLNLQAGINITHIPYKGSAPAVQSLLSGDTDLTLVDSTAKPYMDSGKIIGLVVGQDERWSFMPEVPTAPEAGVPNYHINSWNGVVGPPGLPPEVQERLARVYNDAARSPETRAKLEANGWVISATGSQGMLQKTRADIDLFRPIVRAANIKIDQ